MKQRKLHRHVTMNVHMFGNSTRPILLLTTAFAMLMYVPNAIQLSHVIARSEATKQSPSYLGIASPLQGSQ
jgi:hypothetical protein